MSATSTIRGVILVAAVVVGILLIGQAFGSSASGTLQASSPKPSPSPSSPPSPSPSLSTTPALTHATAVKGVPIQVLNGSGNDGLGATVAESLKNKGYKVVAVETAGAASAKTTIYYEQGAKELGEYMKEHYIPFAVVKPAKNLFSAHVQLTVIVGSDYHTT
jgi:ABC-type antimicrobial peptide transport system permease subunit